jgi:hypothetical protein
MKPLPRPLRTPAILPDSLNHLLNLYALAASATGVSLVALAQPSEAKIIYTKAHQVIGMNGVYPLDLNHDGIIDFLINQTSATAYSLLAQAAYGNAIVGKKTLAAALKKGSVIGPGRSFTSGVAWAAQMAHYTCTEGGSCRWRGQWVNAANRYLGLRFQIDKKAHYGWARLSTHTQGSQIITTLTGYAYETIANKGIRAGQLRPTNQIPHRAAPVVKPVRQTSRPISLGQLALGARGPAPQRLR